MRRLAAGRFDDVVFLSEEGVERLLGTARRLRLELAIERALSGARIFSRGPLPARALAERGLPVHVQSRPPTLGGVIASLRRARLRGRRVGLQLRGEDGGQGLLALLRRGGAAVEAVRPYLVQKNERSLWALADELSRHRLDAVVFATSSQVARLLSVAREQGAEPSLRAGLARAHVCALGSPIVAYLRRLNIRVDCGPTCRLLELQLAASLLRRGQSASP